MAKILAPDWLSTPFLVQQDQQHLSGSLEFLSRIVRAKNTWKSSATAKRKFLKANFRFLEETAKYYWCQKLKTCSDLFA